MREMVLNHASLVAAEPHTILGWLRELADGVYLLGSSGIVASWVRTSSTWWDAPCWSKLSFERACETLKHQWDRDKIVLIQGWLSKAPYLDDVEQQEKDRLLLCEARGYDTFNLPREDGEPLVYCAITNGIAVGFQSNPIWDRDQIDVHFLELLDEDSDPVEASEIIDNLTRPQHAESISERHRANMRDFSSFEDMWERRDEAFPNLVFGPDVQTHLKRINPSALSAIDKRLTGLDRTVKDWRKLNSAIPQWPSHVTDESSSVYNDVSLRERRRFASNAGKRELFMWHARFGSSGRIHFRVETSSREIEIGYIGEHLPL